MKYNELTLSKNPSKRRVGRGIAAGQGKTAGRGTKGQKARAGNGRRPGFEGGQNPLMSRLPKLRGFRSIRPTLEVVYTGQLDDLGVSITNQSLSEAGLISSPNVSVKVVVKGSVSKKHTVKLQGASQTALSAIEKAGGSFEKVLRQGRSKSTKPDTKA